MFDWMLPDCNPIDCFCQGVVAACGISVLSSLMRVHYLTQTFSEHETEAQPSSSSSRLTATWITWAQFWSLTVLLALVGSRVSSLVVLEFCLRAVLAWMSDGQDANARGLELLLIQCQFSLGCGLTCALSFLHQGAPHRTLNILLAAALSWALAGSCHSLWSHVSRLYPLHAAERYCGRCITLRTSGHTLLTSLQRAVVLAFTVACLAATANVYEHFLSQTDALKFWTPLTLCYALLMFYVQEDQQRRAGAQALAHAVLLRLGALLVLTLTVAQWSDVLHVLVSFLGEATCLLPSRDLLCAALQGEEHERLQQTEKNKTSVDN